MLFVLNTGRAGSRTIANVLSQHPELVCTHEPLPRLIEETAAYRYGQLAAEELAELLAESRPAAIDGRRYCESANRLSLAVPVLAETFPDAQFLWLVRDGREVVSSGVQRGWFDPERVKDTPWERHRLRGDELGEVSAEEWRLWSPFRRSCWLWRRTNEIIGSDLAELEPGRGMHLRLEDLSARIGDVAEFLDVAPIDWIVPRLNARAALPDTGLHTANQVDQRFTAADWTDDQRASFAEECGPLMDSWYAGWREPTPATVGPAPIEPPALGNVQVDLADLRVLRGELHLLVAHALRADRRLVQVRATNEQLHAKVENLSDRVVKATEKSAQLQRMLDSSEAKLGEQRGRVKELEKEFARAQRRVVTIETSESFKLGHRIVSVAALPGRSLRALRRRLGWGSLTDRGVEARRSDPVESAGSVVDPDPDVGFADLDRLDPAVIESGALRSFRFTLSDETTAPERIEAALTTLGDGGSGRIVVPSDTKPEVLRTALSVLADSGKSVGVVTDSRGVVLEVVALPGDASSVIPAALLTAASLAEQLARVQADLGKLTKAVDRERAVHVARLEKAHDSTQYRLGSAILSTARNPAKAVVLPRELWHLQRRRSRPQPVKTDELFEPVLDLKVVSILDEFTHDCFAPEFNLIQLDRSGWQSQLEGASLLFVESAWRGNGGAWNYTLNKFDTNGADLVALLEAARAAGIPSIFWNKEDPVSFDVFLPAAAAFDAVLTTDRNMVGEYKRILGHDRVDALAFAAQPRLHNPIGRGRGRAVAGRLCFAGSWRGDKYAQRGSDFDVLLGPPLARGALDIYDRYANGPDAERLGFPEPFRSAVVGSLPYSAIGDAYRRYAAFLNVNSVQDSPTMFSRRVFELLACGTPVISTPAKGIEEMLGDNVLLTDSREKTAEHVDWVLNEPEERDRHAHCGYRLVHREHTYGRRVDAMLEQAGIGVARPRQRVSVICVSNRPAMLEHAIQSYRRQTYPHTEFVFVANSSAFDASMLASVEAQVPGARVLRIDDSATLGECLNEAMTVAQGEFFAKFDDDDHYGDEYLADLMMTFPYSGAAVAGKQCYYAYLEGQRRTVLRFPGREFRSAPRVVGGTIVADRSQVGDLRFEAVPRGTDSRFLDAVRARGLTVFSADRFNFCQVRHAEISAHTWTIDDEEFLKACDDVGPGFRQAEIFL